MRLRQNLEDIIHSLENIEDMPVALAERNWSVFNIPCPVSGDPPR